MLGQSIIYGLESIIQQKRDDKCGNVCKRSNKNVRNRGFSLRRKHFECQKTIRSSWNRLSDQVRKSSMDHGKTGNDYIPINSLRRFLSKKSKIGGVGIELFTNAL